ncbi:hypothetical protein [Thalassococcus sp. S3]|uniref:hypothetical protein n=1 Tax=Thalassococcus sp. S3 TaxID=2017482 RepID=UPI00102B4195|nr:hypothetical protein [Thalassococcus sp. S3]
MIAYGALAQAVPITIPTDRETRKISVVTDRGITQTKQLPSAALRQARRDMNAKKVVSDADLRKLADYKDGLAAQKYVALLVGRGLKQNASDVAYYASIAVGAGRVHALPEMVDAMRYLDPDSEPAARKRQLISVLYPHAWAGNSLALDAVVTFNGEGKLFGALSEKTRQRILTHAEDGDGRIELRMALNLLDTPAPTRADLEQAKVYLGRAAKSKTLSVATTAANLIPLIDERHTKLASATN